MDSEDNNMVDVYISPLDTLIASSQKCGAFNSSYIIYQYGPESSKKHRFNNPSKSGSLKMQQQLPLYYTSSFWEFKANLY